MKTLNEVELHILANGYKMSEIDKICGYLIGTGIKDADVELCFSIGDGTFDEFYAWFNDIPVGDAADTEECSRADCVLCSILRDIAERLENATDKKEQNYYIEQLEFLIDAFDLDEDDSE